ncbi:MAG: hypothetical protein EPO21_18720 [Chloroflexota bacterium]|nr:MAG: hypothetical protein EPO21_18720 [Chloroflexota bacterium]
MGGSLLFRHDRFLTRQASDWETIYGTYLYPLRAFDDDGQISLDYLIEIIYKVVVDDTEVMITRGGGLFIRPPQYLPDLYRDVPGPGSALRRGEAVAKFKERATDTFNKLVCELTLHGVVSEPASPALIGYGKLIEDRALIVSAEVGRETYFDRLTLTSIALQHKVANFPGWLNVHPQQILRDAAGLNCVNSVARLAPAASALVAGAYAAYSRRQLAEALIDAWIVIEQFLDQAWKEYVAGITLRKRQEKLQDPRTYSAAVRAEILHTVGKLSEPLYTSIEKARKHRNDLAHGARISLSNTRDAVNALHSVLERVCNRTVAHPAPWVP